ncbi:hypothetical protein AMTRI_Chr05g69980 [Amborella trichopoda]
MRADLDTPVRVVFDAIRDNVKKAGAKVKSAAGVSVNGREEVKDKRVAGISLARVATRYVPKTACTSFTGKVCNLSGLVPNRLLVDHCWQLMRVALLLFHDNSIMECEGTW